MPHRPARRAGRLALAALAIGAAAVLSGCVPEAAPDPATSAGASSPTATSPAEQAPTGALVTVPATCDRLVPEAVRDRLTQLSFNDPEAQTEGLRSGLGNAELAELAEAERALACVWRNPDSATTYLRTTVVRINGGQGAAAVKMLTDDRIQCYPAQQGTRCEFTTDRTDPPVQFGETHFFRDDLWIATAWSNVAPPNYTASIVDTLWPDS